MGCSANVMTGEECLKLSNTIFIGLLDTTTKGLIDVGQVVRVSVARVINTSIDTSSVAVPNIKIEFWYRITGLNVDDLVVENKVNTLLVFLEVATNVLTTNVWKLLVYILLQSG